MHAVLSFIVHFFTEDTINNNIKFPVLLSVLTILLVAFAICIYVSRKNRLYVNQKENEDISELLKGNEVA